MSPNRLPRSFFAQPTITVARELLGKRLVRREADGRRLAGTILEAEAYVGREDMGCHARSGRTARNAAMWGLPGRAYVYFTYGMHWLLNVVTEGDGEPAAVLLRALGPREGLDVMRARCAGRSQASLTDGPAKLCQALGIDGALNGHDLCSPAAVLFVEDGPPVPDADVLSGPRVGLNRVPEPWKSIPWRFRVDPKHLSAPFS